MPERPGCGTTCRLAIQYDEPFVEVDYEVYLSKQSVDSNSLGYYKEHAPDEIREDIDG